MRRHIDYPLLTITLVLVLAGLLIVSSASVALSQKNFGNIYAYLLHQALYGGLVGLGALTVTQAIPYSFWRKVALPLLILSLGLVAAVFIPELGVESGGARRWLEVFGFSFQPSEALKFSVILYVSSWLERKRGEVYGFTSAFIPFVVIITIAGALLILQPDIGTLLVIVGGATVLYFLGGGRLSQLSALAILGVVSLLAVIRAAPYRLNRILVFFNPSFDSQGVGYHLGQALLAIGSGGFFGRGFGHSIQKYSYLPEPIGDSIFAVVVEELGFLGALLLIAAFFLFLWRVIAIAKRAPNFFGKLLAAGLGSMIVLQAFVNMAAISGLLPLTGIPLPFISYGGTSLVMTLAMVGIILNVSKRAT